MMPAEMPVFFKDWLAATTKIQTEAYGYEFPMGDTDARAVYFAQQGFAAVVELAEMSGEIGWKPWGKDRTMDRPKYLREGVDVLHFVANLLAMAGFTDDELNAAYADKHRVNWERALSGTYDGRVQGKCFNCKRDLAEAGVRAAPTPDDRSSTGFKTINFCGGCGVELPGEENDG